MERSEGILPVGTIVWIHGGTTQAVITDVICLMERPENFLNYLCYREDRKEGDKYALYPADIAYVEWMPNAVEDNGNLETSRNYKP